LQAGGALNACWASEAYYCYNRSYTEKSFVDALDKQREKRKRVYLHDEKVQMTICKEQVI